MAVVPGALTTDVGIESATTSAPANLRTIVGTSLLAALNDASDATYIQNSGSGGHYSSSNFVTVALQAPSINEDTHAIVAITSRFRAAAVSSPLYRHVDTFLRGTLHKLGAGTRRALTTTPTNYEGEFTTSILVGSETGPLTREAIDGGSIQLGVGSECQIYEVWATVEYVTRPTATITAPTASSTIGATPEITWDFVQDEDFAQNGTTVTARRLVGGVETGETLSYTATGSSFQFTDSLVAGDWRIAVTPAITVNGFVITGPRSYVDVTVGTETSGAPGAEVDPAGEFLKHVTPVLELVEGTDVVRATASLANQNWLSPGQSTADYADPEGVEWEFDRDNMSVETTDAAAERGETAWKFTRDTLFGFGYVRPYSPDAAPALETVAGRTYTFMVSVAGGSENIAVRAHFDWVTSTGTVTANTTFDTPSADAWKQVRITTVCPEDGAHPVVYLDTATSTAGAYFYFDSMGFFEGDVDEWSRGTGVGGYNLLTFEQSSFYNGLSTWQSENGELTWGIEDPLWGDGFMRITNDGVNTADVVAVSAACSEVSLEDVDAAVKIAPGDYFAMSIAGRMADNPGDTDFWGFVRFYSSDRKFLGVNYTPIGSLGSGWDDDVVAALDPGNDYLETAEGDWHWSPDPLLWPDHDNAGIIEFYGNDVAWIFYPDGVITYDDFTTGDFWEFEDGTWYFWDDDIDDLVEWTGAPGQPAGPPVPPEIPERPVDWSNLAYAVPGVLVRGLEAGDTADFDCPFFQKIADPWAWVEQWNSGAPRITGTLQRRTQGGWLDIATVEADGAQLEALDPTAPAGQTSEYRWVIESHEPLGVFSTPPVEDGMTHHTSTIDVEFSGTRLGVAGDPALTAVFPYGANRSFNVGLHHEEHQFQGQPVPTIYLSPHIEEVMRVNIQCADEDWQIIEAILTSGKTLWLKDARGRSLWGTAESVDFSYAPWGHEVRFDFHILADLVNDNG